MKKIVLIILSIIIVPIFILSVFLAYQKVVLKMTPSFLGYSFYVNTGSSMEPYIMPGDGIIVKNEDNYSVNDVITFKKEEGYVTTHRIIGLKDGLYETKGDTNNYIDGDKISNNVIYGKVIKVIRNYNSIWNFLYSNFGYILLGFVIFSVIVIGSKKHES